jgi:hypothetical protein
MDVPICPECPRKLAYVKDAPAPESPATATEFTVPLTKEIWRCQEHGLFRVHQSGHIEPYRE